MQLPIHCEVLKVSNRLQRYDVFPISWRVNVSVTDVDLSDDNVTGMFYWFSDDCHNVSVGDLMVVGRNFPGVLGVLPGGIAG